MSSTKKGRRERALAAWEAETTAPSRPVRTRARQLNDVADEMKHNHWDDFEMSSDEVAAAEEIVAGQAVACADVGEAYAHGAAQSWDRHYEENLRNYKDRQYLRNEFPTLLVDEGKDLFVLETGCGVGNTLLPLLGLGPRVKALGCDHATTAVDKANERLAREGLSERGFAFGWDIGRPTTVSGAPPPRGVDVVLAIFTLSALEPQMLPKAFKHLAACLKPGGQLLLRDYGRLDLKQLKFAAASGSRGRLGSFRGCEWYARGDGTTAYFFTTEVVRALSEDAGLEVVSLRYDRRLVINRATRTRMHRVWVVAELRKPADADGTGTGVSTSLVRATHSGRILFWASIALLGIAATVRWRMVVSAPKRLLISFGRVLSVPRA
jgi:tRNAThr (cytosine32-N3)-methyltransferase